MTTLLRQPALALVIVCTFQGALGYGQQSPVDMIARPGRLIDVGGRTMHLYCTGSGAPTVIFESSFGQFGLDWSFVQPKVSAFTRACSYDRAGLGWSEKGPYLEHPEQIVMDLHRLLTAAGEKGPYVFTSISMGGFYARAFELQYPDDVVGLVFIEPSHEDTFMVPLDGTPTPLWAVSVDQLGRFWTSITTGGPKPPPPPVSTGPPFDKLAGDVLATRVLFEKRSFELAAAAATADGLVAFESRRATAARLHGSGKALGARPVIILTAERGAQGGLLRAAQAKVAAASSNSVQRLIVGGHLLHLENPPAVVEAISDVVRAVKTKATLQR